MASFEPFTFTVPTPDEYRDNFCQDMAAQLRIQRGIDEPNVGPGSDFYIEGQALGNELSVNAANGILAADQIFPDTATGQPLLDRASNYGLSLRPAGGSFGSIVFATTAPTSIPLGEQLTDRNGLAYEVTVGGVYANADLVPIQALSTGEATNIPEGTSLQWRTAPPFSASTAVVGIGGLVNGVDAETQENLRQRLLAKIQNPPSSGNPSHVAEIAENASPSVQKAFLYPAVQGPSTIHVAVAAAPTATNPRRDVNSTLMSGTVIPYILANLPTHAYVLNTTANNVFVDVSIGLALPAAPNASPAGPGGGWLDASPWPPINPGLGYNFIAISTRINATTFIVSAPTDPVPGSTRIAYFSFNTQTLYTATVVSYNTTTHTMVVDQPLLDATAGSYIFPQSANQEQYIAAIRAAFELMGPGEKTTNPSALLRGFRHPPPSQSWPYSMGTNILRALTDAGTEVAAAQFNYRNDGFKTSTLPASDFAPEVPASISDPPNIYVPLRIGIYPIPS